MASFGDLIQKAVYLGVGLASYAGEKATTNLAELRAQAQKLADELVQKGEMNVEEARRMVEDIVEEARNKITPPEPSEAVQEPINIEIDAESAESSDETAEVERLRKQVADLQKQLDQLGN
jgi:polyhydroxyalkanoate synthesis regulator phasin